MMLMMLACISTCEPSSQHLTGQKPDDKHLLDITPWHLSKQKPYHKHLRAIIAAYVKTKTLPQAPASHHRGIWQDKNLTTGTCDHRGIYQDKDLPARIMRAITAAFVKTKNLPQAPASHHRGMCHYKILTTSTCEPSPANFSGKKSYYKHPRLVIAALFRQILTTSTCDPAPCHLSKQKPEHRHLRGITAVFAKTKTLSQAPASHHRRDYQAPASHHRGICQDKNLTTSTCEPSPRHLSRQKPYHKHLRDITAAFVTTQ